MEKQDTLIGIVATAYSHIFSLRVCLRNLLFGCILAVAVSCSDQKKDLINLEVDYEAIPSMKTVNVETVISDSGIVRYKIKAPLWLVFDEAKEPRWDFSHGLHMDKYDNNLTVDATFNCDSAKFFTEKKLWRFDGMVNAINTAGDRFATDQLFWNQHDKKVYTDAFIHIERSDRIIEGYGFESNENMTNYSVNKVSGIFPIENLRNGDKVTTDTTKTIPTEKPKVEEEKHAEPVKQVSPLPSQNTRPQDLNIRRRTGLKLKRHHSPEGEHQATVIDN